MCARPTNFLPESASRNDVIPPKSLYHVQWTTSQCLCSCSCAITVRYCFVKSCQGISHLVHSLTMSSHLWGVSSHLWGVSSHFWGVSSHFWGVSSHFWGVSSHLWGVSSHLWQCVLSPLCVVRCVGFNAEKPAPDVLQDMMDRTQPTTQAPPTVGFRQVELKQHMCAFYRTRE